MRCHVCNVAVGDGQRFCHECGESLEGVTDPTETIDVIPDDELPTLDDADAITDDELPTLENQAVDVDEPESQQGDDADDALSSADPNDHDWWEDAPPSPPVDGPIPPIDGPPADAASEPPPTEPFDVLDAPAAAAVAVAPAESDSAPAETDDPLESAFAAAHEPTTTMPAAASPVAGALGDTDELPSQHPAGAPLFDGVGDVHEYTVPPSEGFRLRASLVFGLLAVVATLLVSVADVIDIRTSRPVDGIGVGIRVLDDFGTNLAVAGFVGAGMMLVGGLLSCFGLRSGAGMAGGAGLALAGWAGMTIGLVEVPIHSAEGITRNAGADINGFTLEITRDLGWFLLVAIGVIGVIVFLTSLRMAGAAGRQGLNPWVAAVGAVGAVILAAGPLIPLGDATIDLNLGFVGLPRAFFAGRLVMLSLIAFTGIVGFLSVRTYGLGLAGGGLAIAAWFWATAVADVGDDPVGVAVGNIGTVETTPHAVTTVGLAISLVMLIVASALAIVTRPRTR